MATFDQVLPAEKYQSLRDVLLAQSRQPECFCLQSSQIKRGVEGIAHFLLASQPNLTILLRAFFTEQTDSYRIHLSLEPEAITAFLATLPVSTKSKTYLLIQQISSQLQAQLPAKTLPSDLSLALLAALSAPTPDPVLTCQPLVSAAIVRQLEQERLLNQIVTQMRQSLELPVILQTCIRQVRNFLQVDRLLIMQFDQLDHLAPVTQTAQPQPPAGNWGRIHYEALASPELPSILQAAEGYWFTLTEQTEYLDSGGVLAVTTTPTPTDSTPLTALEQRSQLLLTQLGGQAMLVAPIRGQTQLWGLLIAQQFNFNSQEFKLTETLQNWKETEKVFLAQIAEHLAIATQQAQLYAQLQQQTLTLEQRVIERTQALQEALVATQSANRIKGDFLATISHELRTPLTCVIGMSATLLRWSLGPLSDKQRSYIKTIHDSGEHLLELINDILDLSQVEAGRAVLNLSEFSLTQLSRQTLQMMRERATTAGVELRAEILIPPHRELFTADQRRIRQILLNLLSNAIKFTPAGGRVTLRVWLEGTMVILQVEDTGIGIADSKKPLLFQKFQQLDTTYQRSYEGLGLGLALTKHLVELHQGWIEVESTEGKGSVFTIELPQQHMSGKLLLPAGIGAGESSGRIVLIEDQEDTATLICELLTAAGYQVIWMVDPSTAIDQIQFLQPVAAILSVNLAGMDSYEIVRRLRHHPPTQEIKILLLAQPTSPEGRQPYLEVGVDAYLTYPIEPQHLLHKIRSLLIEPAIPAI